MTVPSNAEAAASLAAGDWPVFPLHAVSDGVCSCGDEECVWPESRNAGKHPRTRSGKNDATTDALQVAAWWERWPDANIGLRTGDGLVVLDVDGEAGEQSLTELPELPPTLSVRTGRGWHYYFEVPEGVRTVSRAGKLRPGLDIKGDGGYVVAPPSVHASGAAYSWVDQAAPVAECPGWLLELIREPEPVPRATSLPPRAPGEISAYARAALDGELENLLRAAEGTRNDTLNEVAFKLGTLVAGGELPEALVTEEVWAVARGIGLKERETRLTIRSAMQAAERSPREAPERPVVVRTPPVMAVEVTETGAAASNGHRPAWWTALDILTADFPEPEWIVPSWLPEGLTVLGGRPKRGKSWLMLQLAIAVGCGGRFIGQEVRQGPALVFSLEDSEDRVRRRLRELDCPRGCSMRIKFTIAPLGAGGLEEVMGAVEEVQPKLVVIDTLSRALVGSTDQNDVGNMSGVLGPLQRLALEQHFALVVIDHLSKMNTKDPTTDILGSTAKGAVPDTLWGLYRVLAEKQATLAVTGRDVESEELILHFEPFPVGWSYKGTADEVGHTEAQKDYLDALRLLEEADAQSLADYLDVDKSAALKMLKKLVAVGLVHQDQIRGGKGRPRLVFSVKRL